MKTILNERKASIELKELKEAYEHLDNAYKDLFNLIENEETSEEDENQIRDLIDIIGKARVMSTRAIYTIWPYTEESES